MSQPSQLRLENYLVEEEFHEEIRFAHPEDGVSAEDEEVLRAFLLDFEKHHEPVEIVGLLPGNPEE
ncbi:MAG: hypothetical protein H6935_05570 [Thiobacillus sp.]|nr:hypothetical protein [Thiobacillus sp.]